MVCCSLVFVSLLLAPQVATAACMVTDGNGNPSTIQNAIDTTGAATIDGDCTEPVLRVGHFDHPLAFPLVRVSLTDGLTLPRFDVHHFPMPS